MIDSDDTYDPHDDFWLEIERDLDREIAEPPRGLDLDNDANRDAVELAMLADEERRRRPIIDDSRQASASANHGKETADRETEAPKPDRTLPFDIESRFYVREDRNGDRRIFADSKGTLEIFQESENRLRTKHNDEHAVRLMLDTAAHRGWSSITVKGSKEFRREAWLEGQARGIAVGGYKPNDLDLQELKQREQAHLRNEIAPARERGQDGRSPDATERELNGNAPLPQTGEEPGQPIEQTRADRRSLDYKQGVAGILVDKGSRPYRDNDKNDPSPYVVLEDDRGRQQTLWGVGLPDALIKVGAKEGDQIRLRETGMERVTKTVLREVDGKLTRVNQDVNRRAWEAQVVQEREAARERDGDSRNDRDQPTASEREANINAAERRIDRAIVAAEKTLHTGPARDAALEDGAYANEQRAHEYMAGGRAATAGKPELRGAATIEAYVERKLRAKFPDDPTAVSRGMAAARTKISQVISRGQDFPTPRVVETRELDQATKERSESGREDNRTRDTRDVEAHRAREQIREQNRDVSRNR